MKNQYKGFSLLELLLVLGIITALIVSAFIIFPKLKSSANAKAEASNLNTINAGIKELYNSQATYIGLNNTVAIQAKVVPDNIIKGGDIVTSFGGEVIIDNLTLSDGYVYYITYVDVPPDVCINMLAGLRGGFEQVYIERQNIIDVKGNIDMSRGLSNCKAFGKARMSLLVGNTKDTFLI